MVPQRILRHIQGDNALTALDAGFLFAEREMNWSVSVRAEMYGLAERAFAPAPDFEAFRRLYDWKVSYWGIGRKGIMASATDVFAMLVDGCASASRHTGSTLRSADTEVIRDAVRAMHRAKIVGEYPHMAASKFLHFYNPLLFPIYDNEVVWNRLLHGVFLPEWKVVCREYGIRVWEPSERFLITYYCWAAEVMQAAEPALMASFGKRFRERGSPDANALADIEEYHATAFEYMLMGAAKLERES